MEIGRDVYPGISIICSLDIVGTRVIRQILSVKPERSLHRPRHFHPAPVFHNINQRRTV